MTAPRPPRVGVYLRVSTQDQSTDLQRRELEAYLAARSWGGTATFYEDKATGTNANRPQLKALMAGARERKIDVVLVWKLDRFARSLKDLVIHLDELTGAGVTFVSLKDQIDLSTAAGRLMTHMLGAFAAFEADLIKERVRAGIANARAKGKKLGRPCRIDAQAVLALRNQGLSLSEIALRLGTTKGGVSKILRGRARQVA